MEKPDIGGTVECKSCHKEMPWIEAAATITSVDSHGGLHREYACHGCVFQYPPCPDLNKSTSTSVH